MLYCVMQWSIFTFIYFVFLSFADQIILLCF